MPEGTIARLTDRGFGFISREGEEKDLFFHSNELKNVQFNELKEGDKVTFEVTETEKGPSATNVNHKGAFVLAIAYVHFLISELTKIV
jgi:CspA family cold shock protein